jgi:hypothetical protein
MLIARWLTNPKPRGLLVLGPTELVSIALIHPCRGLALLGDAVYREKDILFNPIHITLFVLVRSIV